MYKLFFFVIAVLAASFANGQLNLRKKCLPVNILIKVKNSSEDTMSLVISGGCKNNGERLFLPGKGIYKYSGLVNRACEGIIFTTRKGKISLDGPRVIHFIVEPGNMSISFSMEDSLPKNIEITGSKSEDEKEKWEKKYAFVFEIENRCRQKLGELNRNHSGDETETIKNERMRVEAKLDSIKNIRGFLAQEYVSDHFYSYFSAYLLFKYFHIMNSDSVAEYFVRLHPDVAKSQIGIGAANKILIYSNNWDFIKKYADSSFIKKWLHSKSVYDLSSMDISGKKINFSIFKGKYLFVDFWATWCGPCIQRLPKLREAIANTKGLPIEYVSININDKDEAKKWKQYVTKLDYPEINVFDGDKFLRSYFKVNLIPAYFIINPAGQMISSDDTNSQKPLSELIKDLIKNRK